MDLLPPFSGVPTFGPDVREPGTTWAIDLHAPEEAGRYRLTMPVAIPLGTDIVTIISTEFEVVR